MNFEFDNYDIYRIHILAKAIMEMDDKANLLSEETRKQLDFAFQYINEEETKSDILRELNLL